MLGWETTSNSGLITIFESTMTSTITGQTLTAAQPIHISAFHNHKLSTADVEEYAVETHYDLIIAGAGLSGLSAAYFYKKRAPHAKILILEAEGG